MADSNTPRRSLSASPSSSIRNHFANAGPTAAATTTATVTTTTTTTASTSTTSIRGKSTDVGVTKLPARISQNDERLPQRTPSLPPSSSSDGSGAANISIGLLPSLDESPASQLPSGVFTQVSIQGSSQTQRPYDYFDHSVDTSDSQDLVHLEHHIGASGPDDSFHFAHPDEPGNTSNLSSHSHSSNHSSSSSRSKRANTSIQSQDGKDGSSLSSSDPNSSGSAESQASDMSFGNVATSSPHQTPNRSDTSTQSSDRSISNPPSQASPSGRRNPAARSSTQESNSTQGSSSGSSQQRAGSSRGPVVFSIPTQRPIQLGSPERIPGTDPSILTQTQDADEIVASTPTGNTKGDDLEGEDSPVRNAFADKGSSFGSTPPAALSTRAIELSQSQRHDTQTAEKDPSLVDVGSDDEEIDQSLSQSQAGNLALSLSRRRRAQETSTIIKERTTTTSLTSTTTTTATGATTSTSTTAISTGNVGSKKRSSFDDMLTQIPEDEVSYVSESEHVSEKSTLTASSPRDDLSSPSGAQEGTLPSPPVRAAASVTRITAAHRSVRRSPPLSRIDSDELPSSQGSRGFRGSSGGSFVDKCLAAANQERQGSVPSGPVLSVEPDSSTPLLGLPKKRRMLNPIQTEQGAHQTKPTKHSEQQPKHVPSSMEDEFWEGTEPDDRPVVERSRSRSQDISSFPNDLTSELEEPPSDHHEEAGEDTESQTSAGPSTPTKTQTRHSQSLSKALPRPVTSQSRTLRRRSGQHNVAQGPVTSPRRSIRRHNSTINDLRLYKADDAVWARWKKRDYYAGVVTEKKAEKYRIFFLDNDHGDCEAGEMRPLKLKLGAEVLAQKTEGYYPAIVEGMHMSSTLDQSRVDVRFTQDDVEGNFPLSKICLTTEMMDALDTALAMDVDQEPQSSLPASLPQTRQLRGPSREASFSTLTRKTASPSVSPQKTPSKGKGRAIQLPQRTLSSLSSFSGSSSPSRRDKVTFQNVGPMTPSRRSKDLFKDYQFVLSLSGGPGGSQGLEREVTAKIKAGGGEVLESFAALDQHRRTNAQVLLISFSYLRTPKYMEALALNVPRLSYRWIDACTEDRKIVPQSSYLLPSGVSKELDTVVSAVPAHDRGIFENVTIGICGTRAFRDHWERTLISAGAKVEIVSGKTGTRDCAYVVFQNLKAHEKYSQGQPPLPTLSTEWLVQCLINQRIVSINGHPVYTELSQ